MAKGLPYFKFTPTEWLTGDICCEDFEVQGLFINICALYWQRDGILSVEDINKRYKKPTAFDSLIDRFISVIDGLITIDFLKEQLEERGHQSVVNSANGKKGGRPKTKGTKPNANRTLSETKAKKSQQEEEEDKEEEKEKELLFERFWDLYNKKVDKKTSMLRFLNLKQSDIDKIFITLPEYLKINADIKYRKDPSTYLNKECWNDETTVTTKEPHWKTFAV
jgi:hypothetical protein